uniref:RRM domain-containing protein n=1 Tax=Rhabditophanes sp. KR3021 TaxID=114890 RepID=A0AC35UG36_9BILA
MTIVVSIPIDNDRNELDDESRFEDPEDFVDDIDVDELANQMLAQSYPDLESYEERSLVIFGLPVTSSAKLEKLNEHVKKIISTSHSNFEIHVPVLGDGSTKGYMFVEFPTSEIAERALTVLDGFKFSKYEFKVFKVSGRKSLAEPLVEWKEPTPRDYINPGNVFSHLVHPKCLDQFGLQFSNSKESTQTGIFWYQKEQEPMVVSENDSLRPNWSENPFCWSTKGTYFTTLHKQGCQIWGGVKFERVQRFAHSQPHFVDFSPDEKFFVAFSMPHQNRFDQPCLTIFNTINGDVVKEFTGLQVGLSSENPIPEWPLFQWSFDDKYVAYVKKKTETIQVFDTEDFSKADSVPLSSINKIQWSPNTHTIAYYCEEVVKTTNPADIGIIAYPSKERLRSTKMFSCCRAEFYWHPNGRKFAFVSERYGRRTEKNGEVKLFNFKTHVDVFDLFKKETPVQNVMIDDQFIHFAWDPSSDKFALLCGSSIKVVHYIYNVDANKHAPVVLLKDEKNACVSKIAKFAPKGSWLAFAGVKAAGGSIVFYDCSTMEPIKMKTVEHAEMTDCQWDPSGRYFVSSCNKPRAENGYVIYNFQGKVLFKGQHDLLVKFEWRPRLKIPGEEERILEVKKNFKKYTEAFEEEDRIEKDAVYREIVGRRRGILEEFNKIREAYKKNYVRELEERIRLRNGKDTDNWLNNTEYVDQKVTVVVKSSEKIETATSATA